MSRVAASSPPRALVAPRRSLGGLFDDLPAWMASLIGHMLVVIALGLLYVKAPPPPPTELLLEGNPAGTDLGGDNLEMGGSEFGPDANIDDLTATSPEPMESLAEVGPADLATPLAAEWSSILPSAASGDGDQVAGMLGDDVIGGGAGNGHGHGNGTGFGDGDGPGSGPGFGKAGFFGLHAEGSRFVYVFDRSESMNSVFTLTGGTREVSITPLEAAKSELIKSIEALSPGNEFQIVFYSDEPLLFEDAYSENGVYKASIEGKRSARTFIENLPAEGNTYHVPALMAALQLKPDIIFMLTDAEAKDDPMPADVRRILKMARYAKTKINVVHFAHIPRPGNPLEALATGSGGQYLAINIRDLANAMW